MTDLEELANIPENEVKMYAVLGYRMKKRSQQYAKKTYEVNRAYISWRKKMRLALRKQKAVEEKILALRSSEPVRRSSKEGETKEGEEDEVDDDDDDEDIEESDATAEVPVVPSDPPQTEPPQSTL